MQELVHQPRPASPTTETRTATDIETEVHRAVDHLAVDVRMTELAGERHREDGEVTIDISEETEEWTVTLPTALHYWTAQRPVAQAAGQPDVERVWAELVRDESGRAAEDDADERPLVEPAGPDGERHTHRRTPGYDRDRSGRTMYQRGDAHEPDRPDPFDRPTDYPPAGAPLVRPVDRRNIHPATGPAVAPVPSDPDEKTRTVSEPTSYDPHRDDNPYGVTEEVTFSLAEYQEGSVADLLADILARPDEPVSGSVETVEYGVREEETGDVTTHETAWVDIDGYDMSAGEFFVDGELADRTLDAYDASAVETATYVEADVFADENAEICGADVTLDTVLPDGTTAPSGGYGRQTPRMDSTAADPAAVV